jgi:putative GTP pyrophosphokinase
MMSELLHDYDQQHERLKAFERKLATLVEDLLGDFKIHSIDSRLKGRDSFEKKLAIRADRWYTRLDQVTDLVGIRIITFYDEDVDEVAEVIKKEFLIDDDNSIDKRLLPADRFGYLSLHHIVSLKPDRCRLAEYKPFDGLKAEVQIRSLLQHGWAEVEHGLGYKSSFELPLRYRRSFSRLAGLLELVDQEFTRLRHELAWYQDVAEADAKDPQYLNAATIKAYVNNSALVKGLDEYVAECSGASLISGDLNKLPEIFYSFSILKTSETDDQLIKYGADVKEFGRRWFLRERRQWLVQGTALLYLCYIMAAKRYDQEGVEAFLARFSLGLPELRREIASEILETVAAIESERRDASPPTGASSVAAGA